MWDQEHVSLRVHMWDRKTRFRDKRSFSNLLMVVGETEVAAVLRQLSVFFLC